MSFRKQQFRQNVHEEQEVNAGIGRQDGRVSQETFEKLLYDYNQLVNINDALRDENLKLKRVDIFKEQQADSLHQNATKKIDGIKKDMDDLESMMKFASSGKKETLGWYEKQMEEKKKEDDNIRHELELYKETVKQNKLVLESLQAFIVKLVKQSIQSQNFCLELLEHGTQSPLTVVERSCRQF